MGMLVLCDFDDKVRERRRIYVRNVLWKLEQPFQPKLVPAFGPIFKREAWKNEFLLKLQAGKYTFLKLNDK